MAIELDTELNFSSETYTAGAPKLKGRKFSVHTDYHWTLNGTKSIRKYVPWIYLKEYKLTQSGEISALKNTLASIEESGLASTAFSTGLGSITGAAAGSVIPIIGGTVGEFVGRYAGAAGPRDTGTTVVNALLGGRGGGKKINYLSPYDGLYPSEETGFEYFLPYLNVENMTGTAGSWSSVSPSDAVAGIASMLGIIPTITGGSGKDNIENLGKVLSASRKMAMAEATLNNPGAAIETIKKFAPKDQGDTIEVVFYLFNTESTSEIRRNWEFLFTLTYQNLPNRKSTNLLDPPCVYSVEVPGYKRFPLAVIEAYKVSNEGTTRLINLDTGKLVEPGSVNENVKLIPEAYKISLTLKSLFYNTRNLFYYANDKSSQSNITVTSKAKTANESQTEEQAKVAAATGSSTGLPITGGGTGGFLPPRGPNLIIPPAPTTGNAPNLFNPGQSPRP